MNQSLTNFESVACDIDFIQRCAALNLSLISVDMTGNIIESLPRRDAPVEEALLAWPTLTELIGPHLEDWSNAGTPNPTEIFDGCWIIPIAQTQRRRRVGHHGAVVFTSDIVRSEYFHRLCDYAQLDWKAASDLVIPTAVTDQREIVRTASMLQWMAEDLRSLVNQTNDIGKLSNQLGETYEELNLVYTLSAHMTVTEAPRTFLRDTCNELQQVLNVPWIAMWLTESEDRLSDLRGSLFTAGDVGITPTELATIGQCLVGLCQSEHGHVIDDTSSLSVPGVAELSCRLLVAPIPMDGKSLGVIFSPDKLDGLQLTSVDSKLVSAAGQNLSIFLENAMLYDDVQEMFMGTLRAMVSAIDAKDSYTCGHSERVAWGTRMLAVEAGLDAHTVERIYLSALVHDVGKIGIPESVLCKPGRLTDEEFEIIKTHPEIGVKILQEVNQMQDLLPGVLHHHERFDGKGYPHRLSGEQIPLFGRIICLADSFDAMSSYRTYRDGMPLEKVLAEIERCAGTQFDPDLAAMFKKLDFGPYCKMVEEHRQRVSPLDNVLGGGG